MESSWIDIDWSVDWFPTKAQRQVSLQRLSFDPMPLPAGPVTDLVDTFRSMVTKPGGAYAAMFDVSGGDDVAAWCLSRGRREYRLAKRLVSSAGFAEAMPSVIKPGLTGSARFKRSSPLTLDGDLAISLQWPGPYCEYPAMPGAQAKAMGSAFCTSVFEDRYEDILVDYSSAPWTGWFKGVVFSGTWVITDRRQHQMTVLCKTDTD